MKDNVASVRLICDFCQTVLFSEAFYYQYPLDRSFLPRTARVECGAVAFAANQYVRNVIQSGGSTNC